MTNAVVRHGIEGVTAARGFRASGVAAGIKESGNPDVALVLNDGPIHAAAGVFTTNRVKSAPVVWTRECLDAGALRAVVLNSGGANACTGAAGYADTERTAQHVADLLDCDPSEVGVCSTGLIGVRLPMARLLAGVDSAFATVSRHGGAAAARAIMTTDRQPKKADAGTGTFTVGGMAKGAGMLAPEMATMLCVIATDAAADPETLAAILERAVESSFNRVDSDGCMSTNDTVLLLASGASGHTPADAELEATVKAVAEDLAEQLVADAEGASKEIRVQVVRAASDSDAVKVARAVARSNLFKCAVHGEDPNWGRILSAVGTTDAAFEPDRVDVSINDVRVCRAGEAGESRDLVDMSARDVRVVISLAAGEAEATILTNDLTAAYVHENSEYSS